MKEYDFWNLKQEIEKVLVQGQAFECFLWVLLVDERGCGRVQKKGGNSYRGWDVGLMCSDKSMYNHRVEGSSRVESAMESLSMIQDNSLNSSSEHSTWQKTLVSGSQKPSLQVESASSEQRLSFFSRSDILHFQIFIDQSRKDIPSQQFKQYFPDFGSLFYLFKFFMKAVLIQGIHGLISFILLFFWLSFQKLSQARIYHKLSILKNIQISFLCGFIYNQRLTTKMAFSGYDPDRFIGKEHEPFVCLICIQVAIDPYECHTCGRLFCKNCIVSWSAKNKGSQCPNRCGAPASNIKPIFSKSLERIYKNLDIRCSNPKCSKVLKLVDLVKHESTCLMTQCWNFDNCQKPENKSIKAPRPCCSYLCSTLLELKEKFGDKKAMYEVLTRYVPQNAEITISNPITSNTGGGSVQLAWDSTKSSGTIQLTEGNTHCFLKEQSYLFRTTIANYGFTSGVHYWEILADGRTENELKIGVTGSTSFDFNSAFCDHPFGFAYYGLGQLRHGSNAAGPAYGRKFKKVGVLGVCLNMNTGVLGFSLDGEYMGVAYKDSKLTQGPIYPAVALLHCAGCKIRSGLPVPAYFKD